MKLAIMQPYFLPYAGYFQLIASVDEIVIYDNIKYTKKGWINRNRRLQSGSDVTFSIPIKKASDSLNVVERELGNDFEATALLNQFKGSYSKAPQFAQIWPLLERILRQRESNLFWYVYNSICEVTKYLELATKFHISSEVEEDPSLKSQDRVISICKLLNASGYVNPIGGQALYDRQIFRQHGIELQFLQSSPLEYAQFGHPFVPWLSIIDVLMFNSKDAVRAYISSQYELV